MKSKQKYLGLKAGFMFGFKIGRKIQTAHYRNIRVLTVMERKTRRLYIENTAFSDYFLPPYKQDIQLKKMLVLINKITKTEA